MCVYITNYDNIIIQMLNYKSQKSMQNNDSKESISASDNHQDHSLTSHH